jgi:hypothetical protein
MNISQKADLKKLKKIAKKLDFYPIEIFFDFSIFIIAKETGSINDIIQKYLQNYTFKDEKELEETFKTLMDFYNDTVSWLSVDISEKTKKLENFIKELSTNISNKTLRKILLHFMDMCLKQLMENYNLTEDDILNIAEKIVNQIDNEIFDMETIQKVEFVAVVIITEINLLIAEKSLNLVRLRELCMEFTKNLILINHMRMYEFEKGFNNFFR